MQIHELNNYNGNLDSSAYLAVDNGSDTGKVSTVELLADTNAAVSQLDTVLNDRIDNIVAGGEAPSASEIVDARYGADGVTYPSLGAAIRYQVTDLKSDLGDKLEKANDRVYIGDIVDNKWQQQNGNEYEDNRCFYLSAKVQPNTKYYATGMIINSEFPLIVMFDKNNNVIGTKETSGNYIAVYDFEFITPSNCVKVSVNGMRIQNEKDQASNYPLLYYVQNKDLDGNDFECLINSKQNQMAEWKKAEYQYEKNKFARIGKEFEKYKVIVISDSVASEYNYAKLIYDKNKKYRFFGQCRTDFIPVLLCCDENDNIIKIYGSNVNEVLKG